MTYATDDNNKLAGELERKVKNNNEKIVAKKFSDTTQQRGR